MIRLNVEIDFVSDNHKFIHADGEKNVKGVALTLDQDLKKCILEYCQLSERILVVKLKGKAFNISINMYAQTAQSTGEEIESFLLHARQC